MIAPKSVVMTRTSAKASERMDAGALQHDGEENAGKGDDRADRQVDAAGQDDEGHADGGDAEKGIVGQKIADHARRQDVRDTAAAQAA